MSSNLSVIVSPDSDGVYECVAFVKHNGITYKNSKNVTFITGKALVKLETIIKIMSGVENDRSDCQPEANSIARSRMLRAMVVVEG